MSIVKNIIIAIASVAVIGFTINAFAHGGMGWGVGWGHHGYYGPGYGDQMSEEQYKQFEQKREAFFKETQDLRANLYEKERELQNELSKEDIDAAKASGLQKEISELQAQLDQKRVDNMIEMRKLNPNAGRGYMGGGPMMGYGRGGPMMGYGRGGPMMGYGRGGGYCWE